MKIVQFKLNDNKTRIGVIKGDTVVDINVGVSLVDFLYNENALEKISKLSTTSTQVYQLGNIQLLAPITKPDKVICIGMNYKEHCDEMKVPYPPLPVVFSKFSSTIVGPFDNVEKPSVTEQLDWEVELTIVIGKKAKNVPIDQAYDYILGYTAAQDLSARDWLEKNANQFLLIKSMDNFCPLGPCIVTKDEIPDPHKLGLKTWVNGVLKQNGNTDQIIHRVDKLVSYLSRVMTLLPGDIILTGTPSGAGFGRKPQEFLKKGDLLETEVENIGKLANKIV